MNLACRFLVLCALASLGPAHSQTPAPTYTLSGPVLRVTDGDTLVIEQSSAASKTPLRVRLASIDAPELGHQQGARAARIGQPYGGAARNFLRRHLAKQPVRAQCFERDSYGRHICDVWRADEDSSAPSVNRRLVAAGLAWANQEGGGKFLRDASLLPLEREARAARRGLWRAQQPVPPWQWRHQCWRQGRCEKRAGK